VNIPTHTSQVGAETSVTTFKVN